MASPDSGCGDAVALARVGAAVLGASETTEYSNTAPDVGDADGDADDVAMLGESEGSLVGAGVSLLGGRLGCAVDSTVGSTVGVTVGSTAGSIVGIAVGATVLGSHHVVGSVLGVAVMPHVPHDFGQCSRMYREAFPLPRSFQTRQDSFVSSHPMAAATLGVLVGAADTAAMSFRTTSADATPSHSTVKPRVTCENRERKRSSWSRENLHESVV